MSSSASDKPVRRRHDVGGRVLITDEAETDFQEEQSILAPCGVGLDAVYCRSEKDLIENGRGAVGFLVSYARITRRVMAALPELRVIVKYGIGVDNIDVQAARELGKVVAHVPDYCREEVALHALCLALCGLRQVHSLGKEVAAGQWNDAPAGAILYRPSALDLGVVGMGRIGRLFANRAERLFASVSFYDPGVPLLTGQMATYRKTTDLRELFARCTVVSLHVPLTTETRGFIDRTILEQANGSILINTSRADVVEKLALESALDARKLVFYGADVYWEEPPARGSEWNERFLNRRDVLVTPHCAWYSPASWREVKRKAAEEIRRVIQGNPPLHPVLESSVV
jgi:D-3-phosphoglycerate dehydrogenase